MKKLLMFPNRNVQLITGGFGFIGQYLTWGLLKKGYPVLLLVGYTDSIEVENHRRRLIEGNALANPEFKVPKERFENLKIVCGDLSRVNLGLGSDEKEFIDKLHISAIWNTAAFMKYGQKYLMQNILSNVVGVKKLLDFAKKKKCRFNQISSTFIDGNNFLEVSKEEVNDPKFLFDSYDVTKNEAEYIIINMPGVDFTIFRPSMVVGDSVTGHVNSDFGLYEFVKIFNRLKKKTFDYPVYLEMTPNTSLNIIPIDLFCKEIIKISEDPQYSKNQTFSISYPDPISAKVIFNIVRSSFNSSIDNRNSKEDILSEVQKKLYQYINKTQNSTFIKSNI